MVISQRLWINGTECYCWESMVDHWEFPQLLPSTLAVRLQNQLLLFKKRARKIFLTERIMRSQTPPMCDASGKLNFLLMFIWCRKTSIFYWYSPRLKSGRALTTGEKASFCTYVTIWASARRNSSMDSLPQGNGSTGSSSKQLLLLRNFS